MLVLMLGLWVLLEIRKVESLVVILLGFFFSLDKMGKIENWVLMEIMVVVIPLRIQSQTLVIFLFQFLMEQYNRFCFCFYNNYFYK